MKILAIDTATEACSAAVYADGVLLQHFQIAPREHARMILPMCEAVLAEAELSRHQLDAVAFGRGPGSFTGVRIAAGVAQGLAFALQLPVIPVSTLAAIAQGAWRERGWPHLFSAIDARMGEIYCGRFSLNGEGEMVAGSVEMVSPPSRAFGEYRDHVGAGTGWQAYGAELGAVTGITLWDGERLPQAYDVAQLAAFAMARGEAVPPEQAQPIYLRDDVTHKKQA